MTTKDAPFTSGTRWLAIALVVLILLAVGFLAWVVVEAFRAAGEVLKPPDLSAARYNAWTLLFFAAAVGVLTMVLIQVTRMLLPVRGWFHRDLLRAWMGAATTAESIAAIKEFEQTLKPPASPRQTTDDGDDVLRAVYDLPIEQLCGQLGAVMDAALDDPGSYKNFARCCAGTEGEKAVEIFFNTHPSLEATELHASLARLFQRRLSGFQIACGAKWRRALRWAVLLVSIGFGCLFALSSVDITPPKDGIISTSARLGQVLYGAVAGVIGAFIAMFLRDVVAIVEGRRRSA